MTVEDFEKKIGAELSRLETMPDFFVEIQKWYNKQTEYSYTFYPKTEQGKEFYKRSEGRAKTPGLLIDGLKVEINNFLQEYVIPNSQQITL